LVPAIHRNREEIRQIFVEHMGERGVPAPQGLTADPPALAEAARRHLRQKFLSAKVGISGANFAVAETGSLVVVESEGNGRMCLTLPETLISVVGIEKIVPRWSDLADFLTLLPRSSTGERMNPYTSVWTGVTPGDGPQDVHIVLVDNGRTRVLADPVGRQALRCIRCSACLNVCPVYERVGGHAYGSVYPGPIGAILTPQLGGMANEVERSLPFASSLCGACYEVCPVEIDIPSVLVHLRARAVEAERSDSTHRAERTVMRLAAAVLSRPRLLAAAQRASGLLGQLPGVGPRLRWAPGPGRDWTRSRDLPVPPAESFRAAEGSEGRWP
ncbi:MAG: LUD domain-containing protein, partial [Actinomycetes bacterium]